MSAHDVAAARAAAAAALADAEDIEATLRELRASATAVMRGIRIAAENAPPEPEKQTGHPDKAGTLYAKVAEAMTASIECKARLDDLRARQAAGAGPQPLDDVVAAPLAEALAAIRRSQQDD